MDVGQARGTLIENTGPERMLFEMKMLGEQSLRCY